MYGCESWTIKKAEHQRVDAFELWCWRRLLRVPWTARRSNQSILPPSIFPSMRAFSNESTLHQAAKVLEFQLSISFSNEYSVLISFRIDLFDFLCSSRDSRVFSITKFKSINSSALSLLYDSTLTSVHDYWKNHSFD